jgi:peptidoglycan/LPS O-acetylase OafA/YrhL
LPGAALSINSAGWSLSVEAFLYGCFPWLLGFIRPGRKQLVALLLVCFCVSVGPAAIFVAAGHRGPDLTSLVRYNPLFHLGSFITGMAMERLTRLRALPSWTGWVSLAAIVAAFAAGSSIPYEILNNGLLALPFATLIACLATGMRPLSNVLASRPLVDLGNASYCLYILHLPLEPAILLLNAQTLHFSKSSWGFVVEAVLFSVIASLVLFRMVEDPYRRRIRESLLKLASNEARVETRNGPQATTVN